MTYSITNFLSDITGCMPEFFLLSCCTLELVVTLFSSTTAPFPLEARPVLRRMSLYLGFTILLMLFWPAYTEFALAGKVFFAGAFQLTPALVYTKVIIALFAIFALITASPYIEAHRFNNYEFGVLAGYAVVAMFCTVSAYDLIVLYLSLELQGLIFFILLAWNRRSFFALDATLKYLLVNLLAAVFFLLAIVQSFHLAGSTSYIALVNFHVPLLNAFLPTSASSFLLQTEMYPEMFTTLVTSEGLMQSGWWTILAALLIAFSLKLGVAPFHYWVPSVYAECMSPTVGLLSTASKIGYAAALAVLVGYVFYPILWFYQWFFLLLGLGSIAYGNFSMLNQTSLLRVLAMTSISSCGYFYIILAFAPSAYLYPLAVGYMAISAFLNCNWFLLLGTTFLSQRAMAVSGLTYVSDLAALRYSSAHRGWSIALALNLCSMAGVPPLLGFWGKFMSYIAAVSMSDCSTLYILYLGLVMLITLVGAVSYLRILSAVLFEEPAAVKAHKPISTEFHVWNWALFLINFSFLLIASIDASLLELTPFYSSSTGFTWGF